jgi:hypothetical protein
MGTPRRVDLSGQQFGKWRVIGLDRVDKAAFWKCKCECGTERSVSASTLLQGKTRGCRNCATPWRVDLAGQQFGRWRVVGFDRMGPRGQAYWTCVCECGTQRSVVGGDLRHGGSQSCGGCGDHPTRSHGMYGSPEYKSWCSMIQRCTNPKHKHWENYGGRGIRVCSRWLNSFEAFYADMGPRPDGLTLDRRDNNGNYEPGNCRWATRKEQRANRRPQRKRAVSAMKDVMTEIRTGVLETVNKETRTA